MEIDIETFRMVLFVVAALAVIFRIWAQSGYKATPFWDKETGKFQLNVVGIIVAGVITAVPIINAVPVDGDFTYTILTTFMTVYGVPAVVDKVGTAVLPSPQEEQVA